MMRELDPMLDVFIFETQQLLESLEETLLQSEKDKDLTEEHINEIFRIMHTIKGSASMMSIDNLAKLAHALEDMFDKIREGKTRTDAEAVDGVIELVLASSDIFKVEIGKLSNGANSDGDFSDLSNKIHKYLDVILGKAPEESADEAGSITGDDTDFTDYGTPLYKVKITFEDGCMMENLRAFGVVNSLTEHCQKIIHKPADLNDSSASDEIVSNGFVMYIQSGENLDVLRKIVDEIMFVQDASVDEIAPDNDELPPSMRVAPSKDEEKAAGVDDKPAPAAAATPELAAKQNFISVNVNKLDKLMNLMGEIVTTESMVTKNPEVASLHIDSFERSSQELRKLINELQDIVMSIRMLPVSNSFQKMHRIVRDVSKKVGKEVELVLIGEETEVDKNIIDTLSDPLMHLIRNAVDHGIELPEARVRSGKPAAGRLTLEARNAGGDVIIIISDDGKGLDRNKLIKKATEKGIISKPDHEISPCLILT